MQPITSNLAAWKRYSPSSYDSYSLHFTYYYCSVICIYGSLNITTCFVFHRMKDVELMHMRYAMESAVLALRAMGNSKNNEVKSYQMALCYLKDLRIHLEAVTNIPRKVDSLPPYHHDSIYFAFFLPIRAIYYTIYP